MRWPTATRNCLLVYSGIGSTPEGTKSNLQQCFKGPGKHTNKSWLCKKAKRIHSNKLQRSTWVLGKMRFTHTGRCTRLKVHRFFILQINWEQKLPSTFQDALKRKRFLGNQLKPIWKSIKSIETFHVLIPPGEVHFKLCRFCINKLRVNICVCRHCWAVMKRANCQNRFAYRVADDDDDDDTITGVNYVPTVHHQRRKTALSG